MHSLPKLNIFLSSLNFVLAFVGVLFVTSIFLPVNSDVLGMSRNVTIPYRTFALFISLTVIVVNINKSVDKLALDLKLFIFFWIIYTIRIVYDIYYSDHTFMYGPSTSSIVIFVFLVIHPSIYSIIRSYKYINMEKSFWWILTIISFTNFLIIINNQEILANYIGYVRFSGNMAISTIALGHLGATSIILAIYALIEKRLKNITRLFLLILLFSGVVILLRSASLGPVFSLVIVIVFWIYSKNKLAFGGIVSILIVGVLGIVFIDQILNFIEIISPLTKNRLSLFIYEGNINGRDLYYNNAFNTFLEAPIFGKQFLVFLTSTTYDYSHNIILDVFMGLGIIGGGILIYFLFSAFKKSYLLIYNNNHYYWICLILIQQITSNMVSSAFYYNQLLSILLTFIFIKFKHVSKKMN
ncbi:MAG: O-antigen ligase family protein [Bacteroidetes bacterium]|nr:O-antigen ligase family protein [Bacteroidota bacterium]